MPLSMVDLADDLEDARILDDDDIKDNQVDVDVNDDGDDEDDSDDDDDEDDEEDDD